MPASLDDGEKKGLLKPVPEAAVTILANLLVQHATVGVAKIVSKFLEEYPDVSKVFTHSFTHSLTHSLIHLLTYSLTHLLTHSLTHSARQN